MSPRSQQVLCWEKCYHNWNYENKTCCSKQKGSTCTGCSWSHISLGTSFRDTDKNEVKDCQCNSLNRVMQKCPKVKFISSRETSEVSGTLNNSQYLFGLFSRTEKSGKNVTETKFQCILKQCNFLYWTTKISIYIFTYSKKDYFPVPVEQCSHKHFYFSKHPVSGCWYSALKMFSVFYHCVLVLSSVCVVVLPHRK